MKKLKFAPNSGLGCYIESEARYNAATGKMEVTLASHQETLKKYHNELQFDPYEFMRFDGAIANRLNRSDLTMEKAKFHPEMEVMRENIALVRQVLYEQMFPNAEYNANKPADKQKIYQIQAMAEILGDSLSGTSYTRRVTGIFRSKTPRAEKIFGDYGIETIGAAKMYELLVKKQNAFTLNPFRMIQGKFNCRDWNLKPLDQTAFRTAEVEAVVMETHHDKEIGLPNHAETLRNGAQVTLEVVKNLSPDQMRPKPPLSEEKARFAIDEAHIILENWHKLRITSGDRNLDALDVKRQELEKTALLTQMAVLYQNLMSDLETKSVGITNEDIFIEAQVAFGKLGFLTLEKAAFAAEREGKNNLTHELLVAAEKVPAMLRQTHLSEEKALMLQVEQALQAAVQRQQQVRQHLQNIKKEKGFIAAGDIAQKAMKAQVATMAGSANITAANHPFIIPNVTDLNAAREKRNQQAARNPQPLTQQVL
jgi:hypothetical protein